MQQVKNQKKKKKYEFFIFLFFIYTIQPVQIDYSLFFLPRNSLFFFFFLHDSAHLGLFATEKKNYCNWT